MVVLVTKIFHLLGLGVSSTIIILMASFISNRVENDRNADHPYRCGEGV